MINWDIITKISYLAVLAILVSLVSLIFFPQWMPAAWLILIMSAMFGLLWAIKGSNSYVDPHSAPSSTVPRQRYSLDLKATAAGILVACIVVSFTLALFALNVEFIQISLTVVNLDCMDSSGHLVMCSPDLAERLAEGWRNDIIRKEGFCYAQLASRLDTKSRLIENLIIGYCMYRPPRCPSFWWLQPRPNCDPFP